MGAPHSPKGIFGWFLFLFNGMSSNCIQENPSEGLGIDIVIKMKGKDLIVFNVSHVLK